MKYTVEEMREFVDKYRDTSPPNFMDAIEMLEQLLDERRSLKEAVVMCAIAMEGAKRTGGWERLPDKLRQMIDLVFLCIDKVMVIKDGGDQSPPPPEK